MTAKVVYERQEAYDMKHGPWGYERVGVCIGDRVFWTGCSGSEMPVGTYDDDKRLAQQIAERWNGAQKAIDALRELHATVMGECPSLLNEDSGGNANLDLQVRAVLESRP
jgi:hypothetical protein